MPLLCLQMDVLCTHPMFGPDSGKGSWVDLNLMYEKVRVGEDPRRQERVETFLQARWHGPAPSLHCDCLQCVCAAFSCLLRGAILRL